MIGTIVLVLSLDVQAQFPEAMYLKAPGLDFSRLSQHREATVRGLTANRSLKRPGHYNIQEWRAFIDSLWGPGPPTATKLQIFDFFWDLIDKQYAGFPHLAVNWDSLKAVYRPQIEAGVSRGRFWGIMGRMYLSLQEVHTWISDLDLDSYFMEEGKIVYKPGIPAFFPSGWGWAGSFGAALTPLPDSSLLVYKALPGHPLGIVPGDIVLGYDRIPWKQIYPELLSVEFPIEWWGGTNYGSSPRSMTHGLLGSAGSNWGLFDTVDVVKYSTGDTVHLATAPLAGLDYLSLFSTEQVAVPGVKMPDWAKGERVTWGVVDGTSIGYVYAYCWDAAVGPVFESAIRDLIVTKKVSGLILDFRYNIGSVDSWSAANAGLDYLFKEDPITPSRARTATRVNPTDHFGFTFSAPPGSFQPRPDYYDRPIAVLTGPYALSLGDHVPFRMRAHPMVRVFGLPTNGAFIAGHGAVIVGPVFGNWYSRCATTQLQSLVNNEGFLMHNTPPVDEEVWLTRDGVARGEDDVVKRAIEWITTVSYAHNLQVSPHGRDTVLVRAAVDNPLGHELSVVVILTDKFSSAADSTLMFDDGLHGDGAPGDSVWGTLVTPKSEGTYSVSVRTDDITAGTSRTLLNVAEFIFTHKAVISLDTRAIDLGNVDVNTPRRDTRFVVHNVGFAPDSLYVLLDYVNITPQAAAAVTPLEFELAPGASQEVTFSLYPQLLASGNYYNAVVIMDSRFGYGTTHFQKVIIFQISGVVAVGEVSGVPPKVFALGQNYPNPFNPTTVISYQLPAAGNVQLVVYDVLGREVATLVNGVKGPGRYEVEFDASNLASGMYLYRLQSGNYIETKKMLVLK